MYVTEKKWGVFHPSLLLLSLLGSKTLRRKHKVEMMSSYVDDFPFYSEEEEEDEEEEDEEEERGVNPTGESSFLFFPTTSDTFLTVSQDSFLNCILFMLF